MENMNIKALVQMLGINEHTLRSWERRYKAIEPIRDAKGRRLYSSQDLERLRLMGALIRRGHTISHIASLPTENLRNMVQDAIHHTPQTGLPTTQVDFKATPKVLHDVLSALEQFDLEKLSFELQRARFELSPREIVLNLITPLMTEVGHRVARHSLTIGQEHLLSGLLRDQLGQIYQSLNPYDFGSRQGSKAVALAAREGDIHEFGIYLSAILCCFHRYRTLYLGPNLPAEELLLAASKFKSDFLIVGLCDLPTRTQIISAQDYIKLLDQALPRHTSIWLGGSAPVDIHALNTQRTIMRIESLYDLDEKLRVFQN